MLGGLGVELALKSEGRKGESAREVAGLLVNASCGGQESDLVGVGDVPLAQSGGEGGRGEREGSEVVGGTEESDEGEEDGRAEGRRGGEEVVRVGEAKLSAMCSFVLRLKTTSCHQLPSKSNSHALGNLDLSWPASLGRLLTTHAHSLGHALNELGVLVALDVKVVSQDVLQQKAARLGLCDVSGSSLSSPIVLRRHRASKLQI